MYLPPDWAQHKETWLTWPSHSNTWGSLLEDVQKVHVKLCNLVLRYEPLSLVVPDQKTVDVLSPQIKGRFPTKYVIAPTNDLWIRDYGGLTCFDSKMKPKKTYLLNFKYNAWGGKYPPWDDDDNIPNIMSKNLGIPTQDMSVTLEGGAIDVNGEGLLLTTNACLLNPNRGNTKTRKDWEMLFADCFGVEHVLWLCGHVEGDDTDGHVDETSRFVNAKTVFFAMERDKSRPNYKSLKKNLLVLNNYAKHHQLNAVEIPMPSDVIVNDFKTPASYMNFIFLNGAILVPTFGDRLDEHVLNLFRQYSGGREVIGVDSRTLTFGQGGMHCISMQVPL